MLFSRSNGGYTRGGRQDLPLKFAAQLGNILKEGRRKYIDQNKYMRWH